MKDSGRLRSKDLLTYRKNVTPEGFYFTRYPDSNSQAGKKSRGRLIGLEGLAYN